ncbi:FHA domain-containing protein [Streptomyces sp. ASQP_92]|uniref:FHA domain-containing protein n=1 Tax=Streptomyces sp. ASQP_92 TaxID=2979116 RepID=UPI0021C1AA69|nr:FHA domain-containing protein [Streptomyces sp. ASQP_92]MCT9087564.1 FHA domain-containing protein [Streptomyces sp. ASQP_92]
MPTCPNGHQSGSDDWCEICGHRMGAVPPPPPPPPAYGYPGPGDPNATAQAELCPQCRTPREPGAPFCEECRWNFLTNTATSYTPLAPQQPMPPPGPGPAPGPGPQLPPAFQQGPPPAPRDPYEYQSSRPSQVNRPAEPLSAEPSQRSGRQLPPNPFQQQQPAPPAPFNGAPGGPPAPPPAFQRPTPPAPPQPQQPAGEDDWMLPPPSQPAQGPGHAPAPGRGGDDDWPQPASPPGPERGDDWPLPVTPPGPERGGKEWPQPVSPPASERGGDDWPQPAAPPAPERGGEEWPRPVTPPAPATWSITIGPDREYFLAMMQRSGPEAAGLNLPAYSPEQQRPLSGNQITIGRRRHSTGEAPDIDLSVPPEDPGVSHQHAVLVQQPDGTWAVVDQNSTNGTTVNGAGEPIQPYVPVPLQDGDRVHVGAWTTITVRRG